MLYSISYANLTVDGVSKILLGHPNQAWPQQESYCHSIVKSEHLIMTTLYNLDNFFYNSDKSFFNVDIQ